MPCAPHPPDYYYIIRRQINVFRFPFFLAFEARSYLRAWHTSRYLAYLKGVFVGYVPWGTQIPNLVVWLIVG